MSKYDDMSCVLVDTAVVARVVPVPYSTSNKKVMIRRTLDCARLLLLLVLVVSPALAGPVRERSQQRHTTQEWQIAHRLRRSELRHHSSGSASSRSRYSSMSDRTDDASSRAAASSSGPSRSRRTREYHWSRPCTDMIKDPSKTIKLISADILHPLSVAHSYLTVKFNEKFAKEALFDENAEKPWETLMARINGSNLDFLKFDQSSNPEDFNSQLLNAYERMQIVAVGIEQATLDQALYSGSLLNEFREIEFHIMNILCQLYYAMTHRDLTPSASVTKSIMSEEYRDEEGVTTRYNRDAIIVREYNNTIGELEDIFKIFAGQEENSTDTNNQ